MTALLRRCAIALAVLHALLLGWSVRSPVLVGSLTAEHSAVGADKTEATFSVRFRRLELDIYLDDDQDFSDAVSSLPLVPSANRTHLCSLFAVVLGALATSIVGAALALGHELGFLHSSHRCVLNAVLMLHGVLLYARSTLLREVLSDFSFPSCSLLYETRSRAQPCGCVSSYSTTTVLCSLSAIACVAVVAGAVLEGAFQEGIYSTSSGYEGLDKSQPCGPEEV